MGYCTAFLVCRRACVPYCIVCDHWITFTGIACTDIIDGQVELNWIDWKFVWSWLFMTAMPLTAAVVFAEDSSWSFVCWCSIYFWWLGDFDETWYFCWFLDFPLELGGSDGTFCYWAGFYEDLRTPFRFIVTMRWWSYLNLFWVLVISIWDGSIDGRWLFCWDFVWNFYFILTAASAKAAEFFLWLSYKLRVSGRRLRRFDVTFWALISGFLVGIDFDWDIFLRRGRFFRHRRSFIL